MRVDHAGLCKIRDRPSAPSRSAEGGSGTGSMNFSRSSRRVEPSSDSKYHLQTSGGRRGGAKVRATLVQQVRGLIALQRHVYFLHQPCQEQALEKAMDFNRDKAELSDEPHPRIAARTHPRIVPRNPGHLRLDKTKQVMGLQDRELVKKRQEARVRLAGALN